MSKLLSRRRFTAAGAAAVGVNSFSIGRSQAQQQRLVLSTYGGDTQRFIEQYVLKAILEPKGINTVMETGGDPTRRLKLQAERRLPRGSFDVVHCQAPILQLLDEEGLIDKLDLSRLPFYDKLQPVLKKDYAIPHTAAARVILYNPKKVEAPTSYNDFWNGKYADRVGLIDLGYNQNISNAALINGGSMSNYEPGKAKLLELKKSGVRVYPTNEAFGQALQTEECWIGPMLQSRGIMWKRQGMPIEIAYAKEGVVLDWWGFAIPKNARNKDAAYEFINAALSDQAQVGYSSNMWSAPPTSTGMAALDAPVKALVELPANVRDNVIALDAAYLAANDVQLKEWWDRVFKA